MLISNNLKTKYTKYYLQVYSLQIFPCFDTKLALYNQYKPAWSVTTGSI